MQHYKEISSKKMIKKLEKQLKHLNEKVTQLKKEKKNVYEQKELNLLNNFEKLNTSKINNINELLGIVLNSLNLFNKTKQKIENIIGKLTTISSEDRLSLVEENKKYLNEKGKIFFDTLESIK